MLKSLAVLWPLWHWPNRFFSLRRSSMLTEEEIYCNEQMDLKHSETGKRSKIILFIFTISWGPPPSQPRKLKKNTSTRPACHSPFPLGFWVGFRRWWRRGCLWFSRPSLRASPLGELREVALIRWMGISPLKNHQPNKTVELWNFEVVIVREDEICWWCELLEVFSTVDLRIKWDFWRYVEHFTNNGKCCHTFVNRNSC